MLLISSSKAVSDPGIPIADLTYTQTPLHATKWRRDLTLFHGLTRQRNLVKGVCQFRDSNVTMRAIYIGKGGGCGLLYLPTSAKAVSNLKHPALFLTRKEAFNHSIVTPTLDVCWSSPSLSRECCETRTLR